MNEQRFSIRQADWQQDRTALRAIRDRVFIQEQKVPREMEWDEQDSSAHHFLAEDSDGNPIGTARLLGDGQIGRMAVLEPWRSQGVGSALLAAAVARATSSVGPRPFLNAQTRAVPFYQRQGFKARGEVFMEAGIAHQRMELSTDSDPLAEGLLGQTPSRILLKERRSFRTASRRMAEQATRRIEIFSYDLDAPLYDQIPFLQALKALALSSPFSRLRILLQDNERVRTEGHRLLELSRRLPSRFEIRRPHPDYIDHLENFLVADRAGYIRRPIHSRYQGEADFSAAAVAVKLSDFFTEVWECSEPDSQLRLLHL